MAAAERRSVMRAEPLPSWDQGAGTWKLWKAALKRAGKARVYASLAPVLLDLSKRITDANHSALDKSRSMRPSERRHLVVEAINELRHGEPGPAAARVSSAPGEFTLGVSGTTWPVLGASVSLIEAMCAPRKFEQHVYGCLVHLSMIDRALAEPLRRALDGNMPA